MEKYASVANRYDRWNLSVAGRYQKQAVLAEIGDLAGRTVLDAGCGTGFYSRLFARGGAGRVVGVDRFEEMLAVAESVPGEVEYLLGDATSFAQAGRFDLVTALWLVNRAETRPELDAMTNGLADAGDDLLLLTSNPDLGVLGTHDVRYGLQQRPNGPAVDGRLPFEAKFFHNGEEIFSFQSGTWSLRVLTESLAAAGYTTIRRVVPVGDAPAELVARPPFMMLRATMGPGTWTTARE